MAKKYPTTITGVKKEFEKWSSNQTNYRTKPAGRPVKIHPKGYPHYPHGYFYIEGAYGGYKILYKLPYSTAVLDVSHGFVTPPALMAFMETVGKTGLGQKYKRFERIWVPKMKEEFQKEKAKMNAKLKR